MTETTKMTETTRGVGALEPASFESFLSFSSFFEEGSSDV